ncbi:hypothetical protein HK405_003793 [Cladochytrium tenue]|nr:hypothetical protein HK405_003793 [Cladochytrium tenue]
MSNSTDTDTSVSLKSVLSAFGVHTAIAFGLIIAFSILRPRNKVVYQPRLKFSAPEKKPVPIGGAPTAWIKPVIKVDASNAVELLGLDTVMFLRTSKMLLRFFTLLGIIGIGLCVFNSNYAKIAGPADTGADSSTNTSSTSTLTSSTFSSSLSTTATDSTSSSSSAAAAAATAAAANALGLWVRDDHVSPGHLDRRDDNLNSTIVTILGTTLNSLTIGQIDFRSPWFWLPAGLTWLISVVAYVLFYLMWADYIKLRKDWFNSKSFQESYNNRLLLVTDIPESLHYDGKLLEYVASISGKHKPRQAVLNPDVNKLEKLVKEHQKATVKLEKILAKYLKDPDNLPAKRPTMNNPKTSQRVDAIGFLSGELNRLEEEIYRERAAPDNSRRPTSAGFVSFPTIQAAHAVARRLRPNLGGLDFVSASTLQSPVLPAGSGTPPFFRQCPPFDDVMWDSIGRPTTLRVTYRMIAVAGFAGLTVGWTFLTLGIDSLSDLQTTFANSPAVLLWLNNNPTLTVILQAFLSPILLAIASALLPIVITFLTKLQGVRSSQGLQKSVLYKLFVFYVYQIFVFSIFSSVIKASNSGSTSTNITDLLKKRVTDAIRGLADNSNLYITYLLAYFTGYGMEIAQGVPLLKSFIKRRMFRLSPREEYELNKPPQFNFTQIYGSLIMGYLIALTFAVVAPLILPFAVIYFTLVFVIMKYQFLYVYENREETGGTWWPKVYNLLTIGIGFFQTFTFVVIFAANTQSTNQRQWILVVPLPFLTGALWIASQRFLLPQSKFVGRSPAAAAYEYDSGQARSDSSMELRGIGANKLSNDSGLSEVGATAADAVSASLALEDMAFDPALVKPLMKVWVWQRSRHLLPALHTPRYDSLDDYVRKNPGAVDRAAWRRRQRVRLVAMGKHGRIDAAAAAAVARRADSAASTAQGNKQGAGRYGVTAVSAAATGAFGALAHHHQHPQQQQQPYATSRAPAPGFYAQQQQQYQGQHRRGPQDAQSTFYSTSDVDDDADALAAAADIDEARRRQELLERAAALAGAPTAPGDDEEVGARMIPPAPIEDLLPPEEIAGMQAVPVTQRRRRYRTDAVAAAKKEAAAGEEQKADT